MNTLFICLTILASVFMICNTVRWLYSAPEEAEPEGITQSELDEAYKELEKDPTPDFVNAVMELMQDFDNDGK